MKLSKIYSIILPSLLLIYFVSAAQNAGKQFGKISLPLGKVEVQPAGGDAWEKAKPNRPVFEGDVLRTAAKSRAEITLQGGGKVRIGENSELERTLASVKPMAKNFNANLKKGNVFVSAKAAFGEKKNVRMLPRISLTNERKNGSHLLREDLKNPNSHLGR